MIAPPKLAMTLATKRPYPELVARLPEALQRWITTGALSDVLVDVADYRHVEQGPGLFLIGYSCNYQVWCGATHWEVACRQKRAFAARDNPLRAVFASALRVAQLLEVDLEEQGMFDAHRVRITSQDPRYRNVSIFDLKEFVWFVRQTFAPILLTEPEIAVVADQGLTLDVSWSSERTLGGILGFMAAS